MEVSQKNRKTSNMTATKVDAQAACKSLHSIMHLDIRLLTIVIKKNNLKISTN